MIDISKYHDGQVYELNLNYFTIPCVIRTVKIQESGEFIKLLSSRDTDFKFNLPLELVNTKDIKYIKEEHTA